MHATSIATYSVSIIVIVVFQSTMRLERENYSEYVERTDDWKFENLFQIVRALCTRIETKPICANKIEPDSIEKYTYLRAQIMK